MNLQYLFRNRECSLQEAAYRLEGLDMVKASRKTKTIVARPPAFRDQLLKPIVNSENTDSDDVFIEGLYEHYSVRPYCLETICICDFSSWFEYSSYKRKETVHKEDDNKDDDNAEMCCEEGEDELLDKIPAGTQFQLLDGSGYITKRRFRCILMYKRNDKDLLENAVSTLLLFKHFRDENEEIHNADLFKVMEENKEEIKRNQEKFEKNASLFEDIDELEQMFKDEDGDSILEQNEEESEIELLEEVRDFEKSFADFETGQRKEEESDKVSYEELKRQVSSLNSDQRIFFDDMIERYSIPLGILEPILVHIQGAAGTGKSYLLRTLITGIRYITEKRRISISPEQPTVVVGAPTNNAAFNIGGKTIHSLLGFGFEDQENNAYSEVNGQQAKDLPWKFENTRLMVLDEVSMIGSNLFSKISLRLQEILSLLPSWKFRSFGGLDMLLLGDFFQLPPVLDRYIFLNSTLRGRCEALSKNHYEDNVCCYVLKEKMRSQEDSSFGELCDAIAYESLTKKYRNMLKSRCNIPCPYEEDHENFKEGKLMVLCLENNTIRDINDEYLHKLNKENKIYNFVAKDTFRDLSEPVGEIDMNYTECGNLASTLSLKLNSPVMLTKNISKPDGLLNGKRGYVHEIDESNSICWIKFNENIGNIARIKEKSRPKQNCEGVVPIYLWKRSVTFHMNGKKKRGPIVNRRNQFPLALAYSTSVYKAQGLTLDCVIADFERKSKRAVPSGAFYTAVTRVKSLDKLFLRNFDETQIRTDTRVKEEIRKLAQKPYVFLKRYLNQTCFENYIVEDKITYLNVNGYFSHKEDIAMDKNLLESDVIVLAETKSISASNSFEVPGFHCKSIIKASNEKCGGMALLCKQDKKHEVKIIEKKHLDFESSYLEYMMVSVNKKIFSFLYLHPNISKKGQSWLKEQLDILKNSSGKLTYYIPFGNLYLQQYLEISI